MSGGREEAKSSRRNSDRRETRMGQKERSRTFQFSKIELLCFVFQFRSLYVLFPKMENHFGRARGPDRELAVERNTGEESAEKLQLNAQEEK